ncbi:MAG: terminase family protein, partial [Ignavibacteriaceae bacterium]
MEVETVKYKEVNITFDPGFHEKQGEIFDSNSRYKIIAKGRRFGFTRGLAKYCIKRMLEKADKDNGIIILWVDTIYSNIERYFDRYFRPELKPFKKNTWRYNRNKSEFSFFNSVVDFRSSDKPENIEGFGYHLIIINEAGIVLKKKQIWQESILPMTLDYKAEVIIGGTPKGKKLKTKEKHLFFELFEKCQKSKVPPWRAGKNQKNEWQAFNFSAYDNPLLDRDEIEELEKEIPAHLRDQEIGGLFIDVSSTGIIKREWFEYYEPFELAAKKRVRKIQIWDTAFKESQENDFSVCETWLEMTDGYYLTNVFRDRLEFPDLKKKAMELYEKEKPEQVWIEDKASGISLIQELRRNTAIPIKEIKADKDKVEYVNACAPLIETGRVRLPFSAVWLEDFIDEVV